MLIASTTTSTCGCVLSVALHLAVGSAMLPRKPTYRLIPFDQASRANLQILLRASDILLSSNLVMRENLRRHRLNHLRLVLVNVDIFLGGLRHFPSTPLRCRRWASSTNFLTLTDPSFPLVFSSTMATPGSWADTSARLTWGVVASNFRCLSVTLDHFYISTSSQRLRLIGLNCGLQLVLGAYTHMIGS